MTRNLILIIGCYWLLTVPCIAVGWNNIFPLKTTRGEVIRLLGEPKLFQRGLEYFEYDDDRVSVLWTLPPCVGKAHPLEEKAVEQSALVFKITVEPKNRKSLKYEGLVAEFLKLGRQKDCVAGQSGSCGMFDTINGFGYSRSEVGLSHLTYMATLSELRLWRLKLTTCPTNTFEAAAFP